VTINNGVKIKYGFFKAGSYGLLFVLKVSKNPIMFKE